MITDQQLVAQALQGSTEAYRGLVQRFQRPVLSVIHRMVLDPILAEDLAQEVFLKAFSRLHQFDPERKLSSWLFKIAHNTTIDYLRRKKLPTVPLEASSSDGEESWEFLRTPEDRDPDRQAEGSQVRAGIDRGLAKLKPRYREILLLRFQQGLTYEEIADVMGSKMGTVKIQLHRARKQLAAELTKAGFGPVGK